MFQDSLFFGEISAQRLVLILEDLLENQTIGADCYRGKWSMANRNSKVSPRYNSIIGQELFRSQKNQ